MPSSLRGSSGALTELHDVALLDLDGVVYVGPDAVPGAPAALVSARARGMKLAFVTNNAARPPEAVAEHLTELGIEATPDEVITSAQAAARYLSDRLDPGARILVLGTTGLVQALRERGLTPVDDAQGDVEAVVQGYSPDMNWRLLAEGAVAIRRGVPWVATNVDPTVPSPRGPLPGNGSLVAALRLATRVEPVVTGKPDPTMHRETLIRTGAQRPIVVGDRLDTDIEGANAVGCPSLLVFSGVTTVQELYEAVPKLRPTYLAADVSGLLAIQPEVITDESGASCVSWRAEWTARGVERDGVERGGVERGGVELSWRGAAATLPHFGGGPDLLLDDGRPDDEALDATRALCAVNFARGSQTQASMPPVAREGDGIAARMLSRLGFGMPARQ